jgi:hypothetical protein
MGRLSKLLGATRGAISTEYVIVVGTVALLFAAAMVAVAPGMLQSYETTRSVIASPYP